MVVLEQFRGTGLNRRILDKIEAIAIEKGCCKLTLEVLSGNAAARASYEKFGFTAYRLGADTGAAQYWQKLLVQNPG